jgi:hypothetical protein
MCCSDGDHFRADIRYHATSTTWYHFDPYGFPGARILPLIGNCPVASGAFPDYDGVLREKPGARDWFRQETRAEIATVVYVPQHLM